MVQPPIRPLVLRSEIGHLHMPKRTQLTKLSSADKVSIVTEVGWRRQSCRKHQDHQLYQLSFIMPPGWSSRCPIHQRCYGISSRHPSCSNLGYISYEPGRSSSGRRIKISWSSRLIGPCCWAPWKDFYRKKLGRVLTRPVFDRHCHAAGHNRNAGSRCPGVRETLYRQ